MHPRRLATGPKLTAGLRRACLNFALEHVNWVEQDWRRVLVFDESRFCLYESDGQVIVYRRLGEQYAQCNFDTKESFGGGSIMVWIGISLDVATELVVLDRRNLNAHRYITNILEPVVVPFAPFVGQDFIYMQNNGQPHIARVVSD
jgi:hypothetical protein